MSTWAEKVAGHLLPEIIPISEEEFAKRLTLEQPIVKQSVNVPKEKKVEKKKEKKVEEEKKEEKQCIEEKCNAKFTLTEKEKQFFLRNKLEMPKRCEKCRKARKQNV